MTSKDYEWTSIRHLSYVAFYIILGHTLKQINKWSPFYIERARLFVQILWKTSCTFGIFASLLACFFGTSDEHSGGLPPLLILILLFKYYRNKIHFLHFMEIALTTPQSVSTVLQCEDAIEGRWIIKWSALSACFRNWKTNFTVADRNAPLYFNFDFRSEGPANHHWVRLSGGWQDLHSSQSCCDVNGVQSTAIVWTHLNISAIEGILCNRSEECSRLLQCERIFVFLHVKLR